MAHELPALNYAHDALEPHIDARTMEIHHGKHHAAYVANLNKALDGHADLQQKSITELIGSLSAVPDAIRGAVRNNGGGHFNHSLFWKVMQPGRRHARWRPGAGDRRRVRFARRDEIGLRHRGGDALWLRLGLALCQGRRRCGGVLEPEPGQPDHDRCRRVRG